MTLTKNQKIAFWAILLLQAFLLLAFVFFRLIDYDEGSYLSAARLVNEGNLPYLDFLYPQMPLLPYAYSLVSQCGLSSLFLGRLISVLAGILLSIMIFLFLLRFSRDAGLSLFLFFLYSFNGLTLNWHSVVKTLVFSDFFSFLSFFCFSVYLLRGADRARFQILLSGFFMGIAFNFRLIFALLLLIQGLVILLLSTEKNPRSRVYQLVILCCGSILASVPAIYLFLREPSGFLFGNVEYHLMWGSQVIKMGLGRKLWTLFKFVFYPQNLLILSAAVTGVVLFVKSLRKKKNFQSEDRVIVAAMAFGLTLVITCFVMSPTQFQYYEQALPYLLIFSIPAWQKLRERLRERRSQVAVALVVYFLLILPFAAIFIFGARQKDASFHIKTVKKVLHAVEENSLPGEVILCGWPAYAVLSGRKTVPGLETWGWEVAPYLSEQQIERFHLIDSLGVERLIGKREVGLIIKADWFPPPYGDLIQENYRLVESTPFADVYVTKNR